MAIPIYVLKFLYRATIPIYILYTVLRYFINRTMFIKDV